MTQTEEKIENFTFAVGADLSNQFEKLERIIKENSHVHSTNTLQK